MNNNNVEVKVEALLQGCIFRPHPDTDSGSMRTA